MGVVREDNKSCIYLQGIVEKAIKEMRNNISTIVKELNTELIEILKDGTKYDIEVIDVGYDVSEYPYKTEKRYSVYDYYIVEDFLKEATGNKIATYESGAGFSAETYDNYFQDLIMRKKYDIARDVFIRETGIDILSKISQEEDTLFDDFNDMFCDNSIDIEQDIYETFSNQKIYSIFNN